MPTLGPGDRNFKQLAESSVRIFSVGGWAVFVLAATTLRAQTATDQPAIEEFRTPVFHTFDLPPCDDGARAFYLRIEPTTEPAGTQPGEAQPADGTIDVTPRPTVDFRPIAPLGRANVWQPPAPERGTFRGNTEFIPIPDRWRIGQPQSRGTRGALWNPYDQNVLKGDYALPGTQDKFLVATLTSDTLLEARRLPVPSGVSSLEPTSFDFFGSGKQYFVNQNFILSVEFFQGDASYKPRDFELRITPVFNINYVQIEELGVTNPDVREGRYRGDEWIGFQEAFVEKHLGDLSNNYDFWSVRAGIQGFNADFRGFLFADNEPGIRFFGTLDNNQIQWNLAWFHQLEKDTNSGLNSYTLRPQDIFVANIFFQDSLRRFAPHTTDPKFFGYTTLLSFVANLDSGNHGEIQLDDNGFIVRPEPIGTIQGKDVHAYYIGWGGDGHIGRFNISHQFYQALGVESFNAIADQGTDINAQFFAAELSYDQDWIRYRASFVYASGDDDPTDSSATGFDSIFDNPNFAGGGFNFFTRQAIKLTGSGVNLVNRNSFLPDLRTSKEQGQANFVNPGLFLYNVGVDFELTPKVKLITNASYLQFADTKSIQVLLHDDKIGRDIGFDLSMGVQYRPLLTNNVIFTFGAAALIPANGFKDIYTDETLYSCFGAITLTY